MSGSEVDAGLEFGVSGDESMCVAELGSSILVESARSVELPGSCALRSGHRISVAARRESRMSETLSLMYVDTWDLKV